MVALGRAAPTFSKAQIQIYSPAGEPLLLISVDNSLTSHLVFLADSSAATVGPGQDHTLRLDGRRKTRCAQ